MRLKNTLFTILCGLSLAACASQSGDIDADTLALLPAFERAMIEQADCVVQDDDIGDKVLAQAGVSEDVAIMLVLHLDGLDRILDSPNGEGIRLVHDDCPELLEEN